MPTSSSPLTVQLTLSGRPLSRRAVRFDGQEAAYRTDERGHVDLVLGPGTYRGTVEVAGGLLPFDFVSAVGLRRVRVDLRLPEQPLDDPAATQAMPSSRYLPLSLLGQGTSGRVYCCRDTALDRLVAVKILHEDFAGLPQNNEDFLTEARRLARVESPHLIDIYDVGIHEGLAYMVVEYVDGPNLAELRVGESTLEPGTLAAAGIQLAQALNAIHEAGLVHRDVKPSNGLVDNRGVVRLADFGLARPMIDLANPQSRVFGTPPFMSPEQLQGRPTGPAADIYSLGAGLYDMATGHPPFYEGDLLLAALFDPVPDVRGTRPDVPAELAGLLSRMMAKSPDDRPDAFEVIDTLIPLAADAPTSAVQPYLPRLSGSALGLRWVAGPATQRVDRLRASGELETLPSPAGSEHWGDSETVLMPGPPAIAPEPDQADRRAASAGSPSGSAQAASARDAAAVRDRVVSLLVGLAAGLASTLALLAIAG